jgi:hypothetical protein
LEEEMNELEEGEVSGAQLQGRWILIEGKIPVLDKNIRLRSLSHLLREQ